MSNENNVVKTQLLILKGAISEMTVEQQNAVKYVRVHLDRLVAEYGEATAIAMAMLGLEQQLED